MYANTKRKLNLNIFIDYTDYINGIWKGLNAAIVKDNDGKFSLQGPAGLFRDYKNHQLCWGILDSCNSNKTTCRIDILSYHRKGEGEAQDVLSESFELVDIIHRQFPNLRNMKIANRYFLQ